MTTNNPRGEAWATQRSLKPSSVNIMNM